MQAGLLEGIASIGYPIVWRLEGKMSWQNIEISYFSQRNNLLITNLTAKFSAANPKICLRKMIAKLQVSLQVSSLSSHGGLQDGTF